jgi:hypothetical protein
MAAPPLPGIDVPVVNPQTGHMNQAWYSYFQDHQKLTQLPDVDRSVTLSNGMTLVYNATSKLWVPT